MLSTVPLRLFSPVIQLQYEFTKERLVQLKKLSENTEPSSLLSKQHLQCMEDL